MRKNIKNYTTTIKVEKTIMEIQSLLAGKGAQKIMVEYESGVPSGITFLLNIPQGQIPVKLPARIEKVQTVFYAHKKLKYNWEKPAPLTQAEKEQAKMTGWRNIKDWIDAQIALIETEMVTMQEVFLPYIIMGEQTLFEKFTDGQLKLN